MSRSPGTRALWFGLCLPGGIPTDGTVSPKPFLVTPCRPPQGDDYTRECEASREQTRETALELAELERFIWADDWVSLWVALQRQRARLAVAGVPDELSQMLSRVTRASWRDNRATLEQSGDTEGGIAVDLLDAMRQLQAAARAHLLRGALGRGRESLTRAALATSLAALEEHEAEDPGW